MRRPHHHGSSHSWSHGKAKAHVRTNFVMLRKIGSFTWSGFMGLNPDSENGAIRAGLMVGQALVMENFV